jgi:hypothetical protein
MTTEISHVISNVTARFEMGQGSGTCATNRIDRLRTAASEYIPISPFGDSK